MFRRAPRPLQILALGSATALTLTACSAESEAEDTASAETIQVEDNHGTVSVPTQAGSVVATDNRSFRTLAEWNVPLSAAPVSLMAEQNPYTQDDAILNIGNHREPDLEQIVAAQPDLIINGQRFADYYDQIAELAPDAAIVELDPREDEKLDDELNRQISTLGTVFGQEDAADALIEEHNAAIERVAAAYDSQDSVMSLLTSGGDISFVAPHTGRSIGPVYDVLDLTPSLETDSEEASHGDDISVEAIADADPDWIFVLDRDAPLQSAEDEWVPAMDLIEQSEALQDVTAVQESHVVYLPSDFYLTEDIQAYTQFYNDVADAMEASQQS